MSQPGPAGLRRVPALAVAGAGRGWRAWGEWRHRRPFWAGLLTLLAGVPIAYFPYAHLETGGLTVRLATTAGAGSLIIGILLMVLGLTMWFQPLVRVFAGVAAILLGLVSLVVSNFGGFLLGFLPALVGGALSVSWVTLPVSTEPTAEPGSVATVQEEAGQETP
jgi:hypothetical protein